MLASIRHCAQCAGRMDTDREPAAAVFQSEPEVISPVHALGESTSGTNKLDQSNSPRRNVPRTTPRIDSNNLGPSAPASSENFHDTSSLQPLTQPIRQTSVRLPDLNSGRRETKNESEIDWIVPKEERVSNVLILSLNRANSLTLKGGWRTHSRRTSATYPRYCYH